MRPRFVLAVLAALIGCKVGPDYQRPATPTPPAYRFQQTKTEATSLGDLPWWVIFADPTLKTLIEQARDGNLDLRIAAAHVEQARALASGVGAQLLPNVGGTAGVTPTNGFLTVPALSVGGFRIPFYAGGVLSWEIDIWGRLRRAREAAYAGFQASEEVRRGVWISLIADVADAYFDLRTLDLSLEISQAAVTLRSQTLDLFRTRFTGGVESEVPVARAASNVDDARATASETERLIALGENRISLLLGHAPDAVPRGASIASMPVPPAVPAGLPSQLLERRPDVRAAEQELVVANANIGVAKGDFFPKFSLTAAAGVISPDLHLASKSVKGVWSVGGNVDWLAPILGGAQLTAALAFRKAEWEEAKAAYERTVLGAFREVSDALADIEHYRVQLADRARQVKSLERAAQLSYERFAGGLASYLEVVTAQERLLPAQLQLANVRGAQLRALVRLYRALGGGWQVTSAGAAAASASLAPVASPPLPPIPSASVLVPVPITVPSAAPSTVP